MEPRFFSQGIEEDLIEYTMSANGEEDVSAGRTKLSFQPRSADADSAPAIKPTSKVALQSICGVCPG